VDSLHRRGNASLKAVLAPEHGFRGTQQAEHGDPAEYVDADTGLTVFSVYRRNRSEICHIYERTNASSVLVDIQDVGTRLYTFIWTLYDLMEAAASMPRPPTFVIADRPNPLGGSVVAGPVLNVSCCSSRYGRLPIPHIHGMTVGELARLFAHSLGDRAPSLHVVSMKGWRRAYSYDQLVHLPWLSPSPNLPTIASSISYPVTVWLEATTQFTEGRGTSLPFSLVGAPKLNGSTLAARLNRGEAMQLGRAPDHLMNAMWRSSPFIPTWWKFNGTSCGGVQLVRPPLTSLFSTGLHLLTALRDASESRRIIWDGSWFGQPGAQLIDRYAGTPHLREMIDRGATAAEIESAFEAESAEFEKYRQPFLLYDQ
jgi:uncharacterized protein YbbC (DUF1343 family)